MSWIDFKTVKDNVSFERVLDRYGIKLKRKSGGQELVGLCPFHNDEKPSLTVNLEKKVFNCFSRACKKKGNVLDFVAIKEGVNVRQAAELIADWFGIDARVDRRGDQPKPTRRRPDGNRDEDREVKYIPILPAEPKRSEAVRTQNEVVAEEAPNAAVENKPLTFELKLDASHPYLEERGVDRKTAEFFGVGFCSRGLMKDRVCVPLHDLERNVVAYMGRWPGEPPDGEPKVKLPAGFHKSLVLLNAHRVKGSEHIVIVEGPWSVFKLHALGFSAVALLGSSLSEKQEEIIHKLSPDRITLMLDGDEAGRTATAEILSRLARHFFVRVAELSEGKQPDTLPDHELRQMLDLA